MEQASLSTAYAAWQASRLQEEKSKLEAKLAKTLEIVNRQPGMIESEERDSKKEKGTGDGDLGNVGLK